MISNEQLEEHLKLFNEMKQVETDAFFYTRLKAKMEKSLSPSFESNFKPVWVMAILIIMLMLNSWMLVNNINSSFETESDAGIQSFAAQYEFNQVVNY
jgi:hypothetical protein